MPESQEERPAPHQRRPISGKIGAIYSHDTSGKFYLIWYKVVKNLKSLKQIKKTFKKFDKYQVPDVLTEAYPMIPR
jgi:hypothetical protein